MIEMLTVVGIVAGVGLAIAQFMIHIQKTQNQIGGQVHLDLFRRNLAAVVISKSGWNFTISQNPDMDCLRNSTPCTVDGSAGGQPIVGRSFNLYDGAGKLFYDPSTQGFTVNGQRCSLAAGGTGPSQYGSAESQNPECVYKYRLEWTAVCNPGSCAKPDIRVNAKMVALASPKGAQKLALNPENYSMPEVLRYAP